MYCFRYRDPELRRFANKVIKNLALLITRKRAEGFSANRTNPNFAKKRAFLMWKEFIEHVIRDEDEEVASSQIMSASDFLQLAKERLSSQSIPQEGSIFILRFQQRQQNILMYYM